MKRIVNKTGRGAESSWQSIINIEHYGLGRDSRLDAHAYLIIIETDRLRYLFSPSGYQAAGKPLICLTDPRLPLIADMLYI